MSYNFRGWLDLASGLPICPPYVEFVPEPGTPKPEYKSVWLAGMLSSDALSSSIDLEMLTISRIRKGPLFLLWGQSLTVDFGPPFTLENLL
jgi:hypothetical protein